MCIKQLACLEVFTETSSRNQPSAQLKSISRFSKKRSSICSSEGVNRKLKCIKQLSCGSYKKIKSSIVPHHLDFKIQATYTSFSLLTTSSYKTDSIT